MTSPPERTLYEQLGGADALRPLIARFVARLYADVMIGFFFAHVPRRRIEALEYSHAAAQLGSAEPYRGRPLGRAHARHRIGQGHFSRRLQILREVLADAGVPAAIATAWLAGQEAERAAIVRPAPDGPCPSGD